MQDKTIREVDDKLRDVLEEAFACTCQLPEVREFVVAAMERIAWLESMVHAPAQPSTLNWEAALNKFLRESI